MNRRNGLRGVLAIGALATPFASLGQQKARIRLIGWLSSASADQDQSFVASVKDALRVLGYVEGRDVKFEYRSANANSNDLTFAARELAAFNPMSSFPVRLLARPRLSKPRPQSRL